ncbi:hypothetical protein ACFPRL_22930 [Pseudoclavibacter helvolus]
MTTAKTKAPATACAESTMSQNCPSSRMPMRMATALAHAVPCSAGRTALI